MVAEKSLVCLPITYEFGGELLKNVYQVNGIDEYKTVCLQKGSECLYPSANRFHYIKKDTTDDEIIASFGDKFECIRAKQYSRRPFIPKTKKYDFNTDIVVFPRFKAKIRSVNWKGWRDLVDRLQNKGIRVFAAGHPEYSHQLQCESAWDYDNYLEASIWAIRHSIIRIGLITALSLLSLMCGKDALVLTSPKGGKGLITKVEPNYNYLHCMDHKKVGWRIVPHLDDISEIIRSVEKGLK